jgi:hypothetical protein
MLTPNVTLVMAITLELTVAVLALWETLFGKTSVEVLASAQVIVFCSGPLWYTQQL